jgi:hypothetical protein
LNATGASATFISSGVIDSFSAASACASTRTPPIGKSEMPASITAAKSNPARLRRI